jgi:HlyD family secretion protein
VLAASALLSSGRSENDNQSTFVVMQGPLTISVTSSGSIKNREQRIVKNEVEGSTTILWLIDEGKQVKKGDLLVELDSSKLQDNKTQQQITVLNAESAFIRARENLAVTKSQAESDIAKAELDHKFARIDLKKYLEGEYPQELQQAEADIKLAKEELQRAEDKKDWSEKLAEEGYITRIELQADELAWERSRLDLELAEGKLKLLKEYTHTRRLDELNANLEQAQMALERTKRKASADVVQAEAELKAKEQEYERQKSKLDKVNDQLAKCKITAPVAGMVVYASTSSGHWRVNAEPLQEGTQVRERQDLIYLPTTDSMMAEVKIPESSLRKISAGMPVRVTLDAVPGKVFTGKVGKIAMLPDAQSVWLNPDLKVYNTEIYLDDGSDLRPGMNCQAEIIVKRFNDAIYVPVQSVVRLSGRHVVYQPGDSEPVPKPVEVGLDNNQMIRIVKGLKPGEKVLLAPPLAAAGETAHEDTNQQEQKQEQAEKPAVEGTAPESGGSDEGSHTSSSGFDPEKFRNMSQEERRKAFESLTDEEKEKLRRSRRGGGRGGDRGRRGASP